VLFFIVARGLFVLSQAILFKLKKTSQAMFDTTFSDYVTFKASAIFKFIKVPINQSFKLCL